MLLIRLSMVNLKQLDFQISNMNIFLWWGQRGKIYLFFFTLKSCLQTVLFLKLDFCGLLVLFFLLIWNMDKWSSPWLPVFPWMRAYVLTPSHPPCPVCWHRVRPCRVLVDLGLIMFVCSRRTFSASKVSMNYLKLFIRLLYSPFPWYVHKVN